MRHSLLDCILHFISFLLLCIWNLLAQLDAAPLQNECVLLAVSQVNVDARRGLGNCNLGPLLGALGGVVLGADELPAVAEALPAVRQVERTRVAVEGGLGVAGLLLDLLQPGALELGPRVAAAQPGPGLGRVIVIQPLLESFSDILDISISEVGVG